MIITHIRISVFPRIPIAFKNPFDWKAVIKPITGSKTASSKTPFQL